MKIVCRCEDVTEEEILEAMDQGHTTLDELKKHLRVGTGPCQGRTCLKVIEKMLAKKTGKTIDDLEKPTVRPPLKPIPLYVYGDEDEE
ncbi:MAG: (2Fe-2S)-binding protein [Methanomicrobia archaeon]|nr:(2Fe-2S)-binding protein [Methanomicrobia archaeon]